MSRTPYVETEFLLSVMEGSTDDAVRIAKDMTPKERNSLRVQLYEARELLFEIDEV